MSKKTYEQIKESERYAIALRLQQKKSIRAIAKALGRSPSTFSREIHPYISFTPRNGYQCSPRSRKAAGNAHSGLPQYTRSASGHTARGPPICPKEHPHDRFVPLHTPRHLAMEQRKRRPVRQHQSARCRGYAR